MNRLRHELDQILSPQVRGAQQSVQFPPVNVWEKENNVVLTAELPGLDPAQIDVTVEKDSVTLAGRRMEDATTENEENYMRHERSLDAFTRTIELPFDVDPEKCEADYEKGVLTVKLQRAPESQPKKLSIKAG
jgi:HSP20 family protein